MKLVQNTKESMNKTPMTSNAASRIQAATAKSQGHVSKGSFAARSQAAAAHNSVPPQSGQPGKK
jgi:hypothetical protein